MCEVKWKIEFTHEPKFIYYKDRKIQKYCMRKGNIFEKIKWRNILYLPEERLQGYLILIVMKLEA